MYQDIAVIGMAGRFPQAADIASFRELLRNGRDAMGEVSPLRKHKTGLRQDIRYSTQGYLDDIDTFDAGLFNVTPAEAIMMDPHQRKLLEVAWEAFDHAAVPHHVLRGSDTAVFLADNVQSYHDLAVEGDPTLITGNTPAMSAGRIARFFGLQGNAMMIDTACSSSLVAIHMAAQELILGNSRIALVGAANMAITPPQQQQADGVGILSDDGQIKAFSADANGTTAGEAVICVVLKTLEQAQQDGDPILAVIKGSAINQEAHRSSSLSAPSSQAQEEVILKAWKAAGVNPKSIGYVEAHGTGTPLGDPIEVSALTAAFSRFTNNKQFSALSSVKTNIGHTNFTAGLSGFVKAVLSLNDKELYPSLHFHAPNPYIDFLESPFYVNIELRDWENNGENPRRAGVNSFGISGTNCHLVLEEPPVTSSNPASNSVVIPIAAIDANALNRKVDKLKAILAQTPSVKLNDLGKTLSEARDHQGVRAIFQASSIKNLCAQLETFEFQNLDQTVTEEGLWFICSGDTKISEDLLQTYRDRFPVFEESYSACESLIGTMNEHQRRFAFQYAYYWLLIGWGISSSKFVGLGSGRFVIKVLKGELDLPAALEQVAIETWVEENVTERIQKFASAKLNKQSLVLELGPMGEISRILGGISEAGIVMAIQPDSAIQSVYDVIIAGYKAGIDLNWKAWNLEGGGKRINLNEYTFEKNHYWLKTENSPENETLPEVRNWFYKLKWTASKLTDTNATSPSGNYLIVGYDELEMDELSKALEQFDLVPTSVLLGTQNLKLATKKFQISENEMGWNWLRQELDLTEDNINCLIYLDFGYDKQSRLEAIIAGNFFPMVLAKQLHENFESGKIQWLHATQGAQRVGEELVIAEAHASVSFIKSLVSEYAECRIASIDFDQFDAQLTVQECHHDELVRFVAVREGRRMIPELSSLNTHHISNAPIPVRKGGVYLITGGASGIGYAIAKRFAMEQSCHFIITGRTPLSDEIGATNAGVEERWFALQQLEDLGATVDYHQVDVADQKRMQLVIDRTIQNYGKLDGVIHAAGSMLYAPLKDMTSAAYQRAISAKVQGAQVLKCLLATTKVDWCVFFSSLNAVVPQKFTSAYTLANAYMDGLALEDLGGANNFRSINWGAWGETGQGKLDVTTDQSDLPLRSWSTFNGLKAFELAMALGDEHLIIADINEAYFQQNPFFRFNSQSEQLVDTITKVEGNYHQDPAATVLDMWQEVLKIDEIGPHDNFFDLGGHSLLATRLMNRLENALNVRPKFKDLLKRPLLKDFTAFVLSELDNGQETEFSAITPLEDQDYYPATPAQRRLWTLMRMDEEATSAYNIVQSFHVRGAFNIEMFSLVVEDLVSRHGILRTIFREIDGMPVQKTSFGFEESLLQIKKCQDLATEEYYERIVEETKESFDLTKGPLFKVKVLDWGHGECTIVLVMHHIISDGWSLQVIKRELQLRFEALLNGSQTRSPELSIQHKDYAGWLRTRTETNDSRAFWSNQFKEDIPILELPQDRPRPIVKSYRGDAISKRSVQAMTNLSQLSKVHGTSLYMTALAAYNVLLYRYSGQTDLVLGSVMAGRDHSDLEDQIGFFVNTLPLRVTLEADKGFGVVLEQVKALINQVSEHQYYPFDQIVEDLQITRDPSRSPLFDVVFALQEGSTASSERQDDNALDFSIVQLKESQSKYDLALDLTLDGEALLITTIYNPDLFDYNRIERFVTHFEQLLSAVTADSEKPIKYISYLSPAERQELLVEFNQTKIKLGRPATICDLVQEVVQEIPEQIAICTENEWVSYDQLWQDSDKLASHLNTNFRIKKNDIVAVELAKSPAYYISILGVMKAGGSFLPIDMDHPEKRKSEILKDAEPALVITQDKNSVSKNFTYLLWDDLEYDSIEKVQLPEVAPEDAAYVLYTSGSTGKPKGVVVEHRAITNTLKSQIEDLSITRADRILQFAATTFDPSIYEIGMALCSGASLIVPDKMTIHDTERFTNFLKEQKVSIAVLPPTYLQLLKRQELQTLRVLVTGGDTPVSETVYDLASYLEYYNAYGPTECSVLVSYHHVDPDQPTLDRIPIGKPIANTQFYVLDEDQQLVPKGISGELFVSGKGLARGYLNRNELTSQIFVANPFITGDRMYKTGDRVVWTENGELEFLGRTDNQVKWRGYRIELGEVKSNLDSSDHVVTSEVKLMADLSEDMHLVAYAVLKQGAEKSDLEKHLRSKLPHYMVPSRLIDVKEIPLNSHGKVDWEAMPSPFEGASAPISITETGDTIVRLAEIWQEVLQIGNIGVEDHFFESGGNSLKVIKLISRISESFSKKVEVREIFSHPTLGDLAELLEDKTVTVHQGIVAVEDQDHYPISHAQKRLWILHEMGVDPAAYNLLSAYRLSGNLSISVLKEAFGLVVDRHDALRTTFIKSAGEARQKVLLREQIDIDLQVFNLTKDSGDAIDRVILEQSEIPFDLQHHIPMRLIVMQVEDNEHILMLIMHHIAADGWSMEVFASEVLSWYNSLLAETPHQLEPLPLQYKDYTVWQQEKFRGDQFEQLKNHWLKHFSGEIPKLNIPLDAPRPEKRSLQGAQFQTVLSRDLSRELRDFKQANGYSSYTLAMTAVLVLLHRYSHQKDLVIGTVMAGRNHKDLERQIGYYLNTLALRFDVKPDQSLKDQCGWVHKVINIAQDHQAYPFDQLLEDLAIPREANRSPLFDVLVNFQNTEANMQGDHGLDGLRSERYGLEANTTKYDLTFLFSESEEVMSFMTLYNSQIFFEPTISEIHQQLTYILEELAKGGDSIIDEIDFNADGQTGEKELAMNFDF